MASDDKGQRAIDEFLQTADPKRFELLPPEIKDLTLCHSDNADYLKKIMKRAVNDMKLVVNVSLKKMFNLSDIWNIRAMTIQWYLMKHFLTGLRQ
jgi:hypothetical protein